jgi:hypothetical protein
MLGASLLGQAVDPPGHIKSDYAPRRMGDDLSTSTGCRTARAVEQVAQAFSARSFKYYCISK